MMFSVNASAQIVYTDIVPDTIMTVSSSSTPSTLTYNLDLNKDGIDDFKFFVSRENIKCTSCGWNYKSYNVSVSTLNNNQILDTLSGASYLPLPLDSNTLIKGQSVTWHSAVNEKLRGFSVSCSPCDAKTYFGLWSGTPKYLGLKLKVNGNRYYGWVRFSAFAIVTGTINIKDYAYDSTPNHSIHAGTISGARMINPVISSREVIRNGFLKKPSKENTYSLSSQNRVQPNSLDSFILNEMNNYHVAGLSALIIKNGKVAWTNGYGLADIEKNIPFTPN